MIIDEIITFIFSIVTLIIEGIGLLISAIINLFIMIIELILNLFGRKRSIKRVNLFKRKKTAVHHNEYNHLKQADDSRTGAYKYLMYALILFTVIGYFSFNHLFNPYKEIRFIAEDGKHLPFASVIVYHDGSKMHKKTDSNGKLRIKKSELDKIVMTDKRYQKITWHTDEIDDTLTVKRSLLGSSLDILAEKLLKNDQ